MMRGVPAHYEELIAFLASNLPAPVDRREDTGGVIQFIGGDPAEVVVLLTRSSVVVASFAGEWETPLVFKAKPRRVGLVKWRRLPENALLAAIAALIKGARDVRLASYQTCVYCGRRIAPEWLHDEGVCQSCADQQSGRVH